MDKLKLQNRIAHIFIDESGTPHPNDPMHLIVYSAVVIEEKDLESARRIHNEIAKMFKNKYIKSSQIDFDKRIKILNTLSAFKHHVYTVVIDKTKIKDASGLKYKRSFVKFFQGMLAKQFFEKYTQFHIYFDRYGDVEFQNSLYNYLQKKGYIGCTLFDSNSFEQKEDKTEEPLLQLADLYAGTISKYYLDKFSNEQAELIYNKYILQRGCIDWFPIESMTYNAAIFSKKIDVELFEISINTAKKYVEYNQMKDQEGVEFVKYLIKEAYLNPLRVISSKEIKSKMKSLGYEIGDPITKVANLRDRGVIVISPKNKKGYKFPTSTQEIADFYERLKSNVIPQLCRCKKIDDQLRRISIGNYGLLNTDEYKLLAKLCAIASKEEKL